MTTPTTSQTKDAHTAETRDQHLYHAYEVDATHSSCMSRGGYGIYTKSPYDAVLESATKKALKGVPVNRWLVNQELETKSKYGRPR
jgi:hypothetical protein